jgi:histidine triad (HIT) family protein
MTTLFSKIIAGEIDNYKIYEDEKTFVFLTIRPHRKGHLLVVPKMEVDHWDDVPEDYYVAMWDTARKMAKLLKQKLACTRVAVIIAGFEVPHAHIHVIPADVMKDIDPDMAYDATPEELKEMQALLTSSL